MFIDCERSENLPFIHVAKSFGKRIVFDLQFSHLSVLVGSDNDEFGDREGHGGVELVN